MAFFAIDGDAECPFSLLTLFLGKQKESESSRRTKTGLAVGAKNIPMIRYRNKGIRLAHMDTRSGSGMTEVFAYSVILNPIEDP